MKYSLASQIPSPRDYVLASLGVSGDVLTDTLGHFGGLQAPSFPLPSIEFHD